MKAVVIDDSRAMCTFVRKILEECGYEVRVALGARAGLQALGEVGPPDLVTVDWHMPEMDGCQLVREVRGDPRFGAVPVLMITSVSEGGAVEAALAAGATEYIMKPFTPEALVTRLRIMGLARG